MFVLKILTVLVLLLFFYKIIDKKALKKEYFDAIVCNKNLGHDIIMGVSTSTGMPFEYEVQRHFVTVSFKNKEYIEEVTPDFYHKNSVGAQVRFVKLYTRFSNKHIKNQII